MEARIQNVKRVFLVRHVILVIIVIMLVLMLIQSRSTVVVPNQPDVSVKERCGNPPCATSVKLL